MQDSSRQRELQAWLTRHLAPVPADGLVPASTDASFRRYYRLSLAEGGVLLSAASRGKARALPPSVILMDAPPPQEDLGRFVAMAERLGALGLHVPEIFEADLERGIALVGDLGSTTYLAALACEPQRAAPLYEAAIDALIRLQGASSSLEASLAPYDEVLLRRELAILEEWYFQRHLGLPPGQHEEVVGPAADLLVAYALSQPQVPVHRDYHSRNLMSAAPLPGVLDFQDMVLGAPAYDLASLLRDCYYEMPQTLQRRCLERYRQGLAALEDHRVPVAALGTLWEQVDWAAVQRHLKVLGIFTRLYYRDGRPDYLQYLPRVRHYLIEACARHPSLGALGELIASVGAADERAVATIMAGGSVR